MSGPPPPPPPPPPGGFGGPPPPPAPPMMTNKPSSAPPARNDLLKAICDPNPMSRLKKVAENEKNDRSEASIGANNNNNNNKNNKTPQVAVGRAAAPVPQIQTPSTGGLDLASALKSHQFKNRINKDPPSSANGFNKPKQPTPPQQQSKSLSLFFYKKLSLFLWG